MMDTNGGRPGPGVMFAHLEERKKAQEEKLAALARLAWKKMKRNQTITANGTTGISQQDVVEQNGFETKARVLENQGQLPTSNDPHVKNMVHQLEQKLTLSPEMMNSSDYKSFSSLIPTACEKASESLEAMLKAEEESNSNGERSRDYHSGDPSNVSDNTYQKLSIDRFAMMLRAQDLTISKYQKVVELKTDRLEDKETAESLKGNEWMMEIERLQNELESLAATNRNLKEENTNLNQKHTSKYNSFQKTNETKNNKISELEKTLKDKDVQIKELQKKNKDLENASRRKEKDHEEAIRKRDSKINTLKLSEKETHAELMDLSQKFTKKMREHIAIMAETTKKTYAMRDYIKEKDARQAKAEQDLAQSKQYITLLQNKLAAEMKKNKKPEDADVKTD